MQYEIENEEVEVVKKYGLTFLALIILLGLVSAPVLAKSASSSNSSGSASAKSSSVSNKTTKDSPDKSNPSVSSKDKFNGQEIKTVKPSGEKSVQGSDLKNMPAEQKQQIINKLQERQKQTEKKTFKDSTTHWANKDIAKIQSLGLLSGYQDGTFKPDAQVSNAEAMTMVVNLADTVNVEDTVTPTETPVSDQEPAITEEVNNSDVPQWAKKTAAQAASLKIININRFHSQVQANRAQVAVMLAKALKLEPVTGDKLGFTDGKYISAEDIGYILALKKAGIINGSPDGKFNPNSSVTRAEMAAMLANAVEKVEEDENSTDPATSEETASNQEQPTTSTTGTDITPSPTLADNTTTVPVNNDSTTGTATGTSSPQS